RRAAYLTPGRDLSSAVELARRAEALGYESVWLTHGLGRDSFLVLAAYGAATTRVGLGVGVVPIYPRHPVAMAQAALTRSAITGDVAGARAAFRAELARYLALPFYRAMLVASGLGEGVRAFDRDGEVPETLAAELGAVGDAVAGRAYVAAYRKAGVTLPAIRPITFPDAPWYGRTLAAAARW